MRYDPDEAPSLFYRMGRLKHGWNGYKAPPPSHLAINQAARYIAQCHEAGFLPELLSPSVVGGVGITHRVGSKKFYSEFTNDGALTYLMGDDDPPEDEAVHECETISSDEDSTGRLIGRAKAYLGIVSPVADAVMCV